MVVAKFAQHDPGGLQAAPLYEEGMQEQEARQRQAGGVDAL